MIVKRGGFFGYIDWNVMDYWREKKNEHYKNCTTFQSYVMQTAAFVSSN